MPPSPCHRHRALSPVPGRHQGSCVPFGGDLKEGDDVVVTGKDRFHLGVRTPSLAVPGQRIHHRVSSPVRAAHGIVPGKVQDGIFSKGIHAPLRGSPVVRRKLGPLAPLACFRLWRPGFFAGIRWMRAGPEVHSCSGVPAAVAVTVWTVRGRSKEWRWSPMPGTPRCRCVRVCQSPVLIRGPGRRRARSHPLGGCRCRRWPTV